ncbi:hypothetical protein [Phaeovulum vinaykumarii]|uniref:Uncharacterized protein n=1 Tax=Phaeovulum vinaykumarii TaxID=407234 RepID=A0A1N7JSM1_9RHOB|nr:hypothetical protein [Phaeovulum vinaykumarii]SIS52338.1 hypothetical protein SAMN05421795_101299 [Phaeovulum vinaykumarii]SOB91183.1 hypothetical protein SAMN05878426_101299 [Phaeovulum vinaykumarii]
MRAISGSKQAAGSEARSAIETQTAGPVLGRRALGLGLLAGLALAVPGCGRIRSSKVNPFNWFGSSEDAEPVEQSEPTLDELRLNGRDLAGRITALEVGPVHGGAVVTARAVMPTQGWWAPELLPQILGPTGKAGSEGGKMVIRFIAAPPPKDSPAARRVSTDASREITAGLFLSHQELAGVNTITVTGAENARSARR